MKHGIRALVFSMLTALIASAQSTEPSFAVVSVKPVPRDQRSQFRNGRVLFHPGGRLSANGVTVPMLIAAAYGRPFPTPRIAGGPEWLELALFVVEAVSEPGTIPENLAPVQLREKMQPMLRQLLAERFKLVLNTEPEEMPVFKLIAAPSGVKLTRSSISQAQCAASTVPDPCHILEGGHPRGMTGEAVSLEDIAAELESSSGVPIVDATATRGLFSIHIRPFSRVTPLIVPLEILNLPADRPKPPEESWPSVFKVLEEGLGLRLEPGRARVKMLRIESIQRPDGN